MTAYMLTYCCTPYYQDSPELKLACVLKSVVDSDSSLSLVSYFDEFKMTTVTQAVILNASRAGTHIGICVTFLGILNSCISDVAFY